MNETAKQLMKNYQKEYRAELKYSAITEKFYVLANVEIKDGDIIKSIVEHRDSPEDAVFAFHEIISIAKLNNKIFIKI